jgi:hypothetical protein
VKGVSSNILIFCQSQSINIAQLIKTKPMTIPPEFSTDSTSAPHPDLRAFPFLKKRYTRSFFTQFINGYFLFLLEDSDRLQWKATDNLDKLLEMVFSPQLIDAKCFSPYFLYDFIYDRQRLKESNEITMLNSADMFLLSGKYTRLNKLMFDNEQLKNELLRLAGLLVIHTGRNSRKSSEPRFIATTKNGVDFCNTGIIKDSLLKYKTECSNVLERLDRVVPFGRIYTPIVTEYFGFLDFTIKKSQNLLTYELRDILNKWYQQHKQGKIDAEQNIGGCLKSIHGPLYYLQGRPSGSAQKK